MPDLKPEDIQKLKDEEALTAARSLIVLLELKLKKMKGSSRPEGADAGNPKSLIEKSEQAKTLASALEKGNPAQAASAARLLLLVCMQMGFEDEVSSAYASTKAHVLDMGILSGPLLVAALAAVIAWVPYETRKKVVEKTYISKDGTKTTVKEIEQEVKRVGAEGLKALEGWWTTAFGK